jgi:pilus assembly protein CpaB
MGIVTAMRQAIGLLLFIRDALGRHRIALMILLAICLGAFSVVGMRNYIGERLALERERLVPKHEMVELLVAKRDLERGEPLSAETVAVREVPREFAPGGALQPPDFGTVAGARVTVAMRRGEPLLPGMLLDAEANGLAARLRPGSRALTVSVDEVNSLSGMLQPGDRIDLMLSLRPSGPLHATEPEVTRTLMQDVLVLATGRQVRPAIDDGHARSFTAITVEVDPVQAQKLVVAQRNGRLTAMLRNGADRVPVSERKLDVNGLLGIVPVAPAPVARPRVTEVIVGGRGQAPAAVNGAPAGASGSIRPIATPAPLSSRGDPAARIDAPDDAHVQASAPGVSALSGVSRAPWPSMRPTPQQEVPDSAPALLR